MVRPTDYFAMLQELGFLTDNEDAAVGGLPAIIVVSLAHFLVAIKLTMCAANPVAADVRPARAHSHDPLIGRLHELV